jgi:hypothetical protein
MEIKPSYWRRINPLAFTFILALIAEVAAYNVWQAPTFIGVTAMAVFLLSSGLLLVLKAVLHRLGKRRPGKKFVAEVLVMHWRGETSRFRGVYRYQWVANFAAQYLAYLLDHFGDVHWEFGICFRVHDAEQRAADEASSDPDAQTPQPA